MPETEEEFKEGHLSSFSSLEDAPHGEKRPVAAPLPLVYPFTRQSDRELGMPCLYVEERLGPFLALSSAPVVAFRM